MEDGEIIALYWARSESAIAETAGKYGAYCRSIAYHILCDAEDTEECVNDTYLHAWNAMPPQRPSRLSAFLGKITRNLSLDKYGYKMAAKRGGGQMPLVLDELLECIPVQGSVEQELEDRELVELLNHFLATLLPRNRNVFLRRYWYLNSVREIAADYGLGESNVKMILLRTREKLRRYLEKEGISL